MRYGTGGYGRSEDAIRPYSGSPLRTSEPALERSEGSSTVNAEAALSERNPDAAAQDSNIGQRHGCGGPYPA